MLRNFVVKNAVEVARGSNGARNLFRFVDLITDAIATVGHLPLFLTKEEREARDESDHHFQSHPLISKGASFSHRRSVIFLVEANGKEIHSLRSDKAGRVHFTSQPNNAATQTFEHRLTPHQTNS